MKKIIILGFAVILIALSVHTVDVYHSSKKDSIAEEKSEVNNLKKPSKAFDLQSNIELKKAPDFTLTDLNGKEVKLSELKGKKVFLNFWATWCPPCRGEMPDIEKIYQDTKDSDLVIIAVELGEPINTVKSFINKNKYHFKVLLDLDQSVGATYHISAIPTSYFINSDGNIVSTNTGAMTLEEMKQHISDLQ